MGLRYPAEASCELLGRPPDGPLPGSAALMLAERAIRAAVPAAAEHAAAIRAATIVHGDRHPHLVSGHLHGDRRPAHAVLHCVADHVAQRLAEPPGVPAAALIAARVDADRAPQCSTA